MLATTKSAHLLAQAEDEHRERHREEEKDRGDDRRPLPPAIVFAKEGQPRVVYRTQRVEVDRVVEQAVGAEPGVEQAREGQRNRGDLFFPRTPHVEVVGSRVGLI